MRRRRRGSLASEAGRARRFGPNLVVGVVLHPEDAIFARQLSLIEQVLDRLEEVGILKRVVHLAVNVKQVLPNVPSVAAFVVVELARCLRN